MVTTKKVKTYGITVRKFSRGKPLKGSKTIPIYDAVEIGVKEMAELIDKNVTEWIKKRGE